jgi:DNA-binding response OmpR family regulator
LAGFKDFPWREVYLTHDVGEGLHIANAAEFDVAMLDVSVAGHDTSDVAHAINKRGLPIVICTAGWSQVNHLGLNRTTILHNPSPGEKLRAALQIADPNRQH